MPIDVGAELELCSKATPGPWVNTEVGVLRGPLWIVSNVGACEHRTVFENPNDGEFIAHAREGYPAALRELQAANERLEQCRELLNNAKQLRFGIMALEPSEYLELRELLEK